MGRAREGLPLAQQAYQFATNHGYAAMAKQIKPILDELQRAAEQG